jgi:hypothetical protein
MGNVAATSALCSERRAELQRERPETVEQKRMEEEKNDENENERNSIEGGAA